MGKWHVLVGMLVVQMVAGMAIAESQAHLVTHEPFRVRADSPVLADVGAAAVWPREQPRVFELTASGAEIIVHEYPTASTYVPGAWSMQTERSWTLSDLRLTLGAVDLTRFGQMTVPGAAVQDMDSSYFMMWPTAGNVHVSWEAGTDIEFTPMLADDAASPYVDDFLHYGGAYLAWSGREALEFDGNLSLLLHGALVGLHANENSTWVDTRTREAGIVPGAPAPTSVYRTVRIHATQAHWRVQTSNDTVVAVTELRAQSLTEASFGEVKGSISDGERLEQVANDSLLVQGSFEFHVAAGVRDAKGAAFTTFAERQPAVGATRLSLPVASSSVVWLGGLFLVGSVAAVGFVVHRGRSEMDVDQIVQLANEASARGDHATALRWVDAALRAAPGSAQLHADKADALAALGEVDLALASYRRAASIGGGGQPDFFAARLLAGVCGPKQEILQHLVQALAREPDLVMELYEDELLSRFSEEPGLRRAIATAEAQIG